MRASIVIATKDRNEELLKVIRDLDNQTYRNFEVKVSFVNGITNAMNDALKTATGDIIIRVDDDMSIPPTWLKHVVETFQTYRNCGGVTGPTIVPRELKNNRDVFSFERLPQPLKWLYVNYFQEGNPYALAKMNRCGAFSLGSNYEEAILQKYVTECDYLESCNYAVRTDLVRKLGGWDPKYDGVCEYFEQDMVYKIKKLGYSMYYNPNAYLYHLVSMTAIGGRYDYIDRLENWLRFVWRHLPKRGNIIRLTSYFLFMCAYYAKCTLRRKK